MPSLSVPYPSARHAWYIVTLLTLAYIVSFIDRQILALLIEPIKRSLQLSDTQVGLLLGPAFAVFYVTLGYPAGVLADRRSRKAIIAAGIAVWCLMTAACGVARDFVTLFVARIGVGIGEATLTPAALSLISDCFPREKRARAISVYMMGISLGSALALLVGGPLLQTLLALPPLVLPGVGALYAWQSAFLAVGLPGLVLAMLIATLREPARQELRRSLAGSGGDQSPRAALRYLRERWQAFTFLTLGMCANTVLGYIAAWNVALFQRRWDWTVGDTGIALGLILLVFGPVGTLAGGAVSDHLARRGYRDGTMRVTLAGIAVMVLFGALYPMAGTPASCLAFYAVSVVAASASSATGAAGIVLLSPNQVRAQATALYWIVKNLVGLMVGPVLVGLLTDYLFADPLKIGNSMSIAALAVGLPGILALVVGLKHFRAEAEDLERDALDRPATA